jgi:predicted enzyme related to lactoylglutathione lyase
MHALIYSKHAEQVRDFLRDVLEWKSVDGGEGWPIFAAPPVELAVHPTDGETGHELYLICDDVEAMVKKLAERGIVAAPVVDRGWGLVTTITMPGGETIGMYESRHPSPLKR